MYIYSCVLRKYQVDGKNLAHFSFAIRARMQVERETLITSVKNLWYQAFCGSSMLVKNRKIWCILKKCPYYACELNRDLLSYYACELNRETILKTPEAWFHFSKSQISPGQMPKVRTLKMLFWRHSPFN